MKSFFLFLFFLITTPTHAASSVNNAWSLGLGYHNPPDSKVGANLMYLWTDLAFEAGFGYAGKYGSDYRFVSDINLKYLFLTSPLRPYAMGGFGVSLSGVSTSDVFAGAGLMLNAGSAYMYASYVFVNYNQVQVGFGVPL